MANNPGPPSTFAEIVNVPFAQRALVEKHSPGGRYIDALTDVDSPWVPFGDNAAIKHLCFDVRQNLFSNILWVNRKIWNCPFIRIIFNSVMHSLRYSILM